MLRDLDGLVVEYSSATWALRVCISDVSLGGLPDNGESITQVTKVRIPVILTINVPVVYMEWDLIILIQENPLRGPLEGVGPENRDFFGP